MKLIMNPQHLRTLQQVADFLHGSAAMVPAPASRAERYRLIEATLARFDYPRLSKPDKGLIRVYLGRLTGYSRPQLTRLIARWRRDRRLRWSVRPAQGFAARFSAADIRSSISWESSESLPTGG